MKLRNKKTDAVANYRIILQRETGNGSNKAPIKYVCGTLTKLNEEWEDYKPKEPLIKDEKIRKAVRAWAEALDLRWFRRCSSVNAYTSRLSAHDAGGVCYTIEFRPQDLYGDRITKDSYTIEELCGEEEECES